MWSDVGYAHQVFHHLVCGCWCRTLLSSFTWVQLLEQVWSQSLDTVVVPVILSFQQCPAWVRITFFKRVHCSVSTDTLSLWSRHFTRLCSSTHPWQRVSEIQFIKEVLYRSSIHWWVFSMLLVYTQQYSGWPYTTSDVWKLHRITTLIMQVQRLDYLLQSATFAADLTMLSRLYGTENAPQQCCVHVDITMNNVRLFSIKRGRSIWIVSCIFFWLWLASS